MFSNDFRERKTKNNDIAKNFQWNRSKHLKDFENENEIWNHATLQLRLFCRPLGGNFAPSSSTISSAIKDYNDSDVFDHEYLEEKVRDDAIVDTTSESTLVLSTRNRIMSSAKEHDIEHSYSTTGKMHTAERATRYSLFCETLVQKCAGEAGVAVFEKILERDALFHIKNFASLILKKAKTASERNATKLFLDCDFLDLSVDNIRLVKEVFFKIDRSSLNPEAIKSLQVIYDLLCAVEMLLRKVKEEDEDNSSSESITKDKVVKQLRYDRELEDKEEKREHFLQFFTDNRHISLKNPEHQAQSFLESFILEIIARFCRKLTRMVDKCDDSPKLSNYEKLCFHIGVANLENMRLGKLTLPSITILQKLVAQLGSARKENTILVKETKLLQDFLMIVRDRSILVKMEQKEKDSESPNNTIAQIRKRFETSPFVPPEHELVANLALGTVGTGDIDSMLDNEHYVFVLCSLPHLISLENRQKNLQLFLKNMVDRFPNFDKLVESSGYEKSPLYSESFYKEIATATLKYIENHPPLRSVLSSVYRKFLNFDLVSISVHQAVVLEDILQNIDASEWTETRVSQFQTLYDLVYMVGVFTQVATVSEST
eukprot:g1217.t1